MDNSAERRLPLCIEALPPGGNLEEYGAAHRNELRSQLRRFGAVLLRGFEVTRDSFGRFVHSYAGERLEYTYRSTPRAAAGDRIYTATLYPANRVIPLHCEESYKREWPLILAFFCEKPAAEGGETPIADVLRITAALPPELLRKFRERGVRYVRNYHPGIDVPWSDVFQTNSRSDVEAFCAEHDIECEWRSDGSLRTSQSCQATAVHPELGCEVFFNQAHLFHASSLGRELEEKMLQVFGPQGLPRNAFYGDGEPIDVRDLDCIRQVLERESVTFPWKRGDVLLVDNMQVAHGRRTYRGDRSVLVAMANPYRPRWPSELVAAS